MDKTAKDKLEILIENYLASNPMARTDGKTNEVEIRFGSANHKNQIKPLTKIDYDNVVKQLYRAGFKIDNLDGYQSLRIFHEYTDRTSGKKIMSNIRTEITGVDLIREYCNSNSLKTILELPASTYDKLKFTQKTRPKGNDGQFIHPADFEDFNLRVAFQLEQLYTARSGIIRGVIDKWPELPKTFRHMNRVRFYHDDLPFFADLSIVQKSKTTGGGSVPMKFFTVQDAGVFSGGESYEIEMEVDNEKVGPGTKYNTANSVIVALRKAIRIVMSGIQGTNYPISYSVQKQIQTEYMRLLHGQAYQPGRITSRDFCGPSSLTLQMTNIMASNPSNVLTNYTVTDKADGDRKLMFVSGDGKVYLIDMNMVVTFTGATTTNPKLFESLIDGEHIHMNKLGKAINLYAAFDVYYINKKSTREFAFCETTEPGKDEQRPKYRLELLKQYIELMKPVLISSECEFKIKCKSFGGVDNIFKGCSQILSDIEDGIYEYHTDGIIFTPANTAVGSDLPVPSKPGPLTKSTWSRSFKWKPVEMNTIDFLVSTKKTSAGKDEIHNIFQDGKNLQGTRSLIQYKTLILRCGYDESKHGYLNPCEDIINNKIPNSGNLEIEDGYKPVPFRPTNPYDANACFANVVLKEDGSKNLSLFTSEGEYFDEDMIVEFSYDVTKPAGWKWVPLRVRYDKTADLRNGSKNYGNAYHVANSNWQTIHQPITKEMISKGINIPEYLEECGEEENDGTANTGMYYNRTGDDTKRTKSLRDFHNLYVKNKLIAGASNRGDILIDYAVGKAGDLPKWIHSNLSFVYGIDISKDNIQNRIDGACARYLNYRKTRKDILYAMFINGNSGNNIRNGDAFYTEKDKEISKAIFGSGPKDAGLLGEGIYKHYGVAHDGFNVSSCQFAMHYFFETPATLHKFLRNLTDCTKLNGYFIGTCFDGKTVFKILSDRTEIVINNEDGQKMFELTKEYSQTGFPDDATSIGYPINVYQETIGKTFREYLVNFDYFVRVMEDYGFVLLQKDIAKTKGLPSGSGTFDELFNQMELEVKQNPKLSANYRNASQMTSDEKQISFMNRYFVFQKVRHVNAAKLMPLLDVEPDMEKEPAKEKGPEPGPEKVIIKRKKVKGGKIIIN
jgi:hypothetical protein